MKVKNKNSKKSSQKINNATINEGEGYYLGVGQIFLICGIGFLILTIFISLLPQDYEKYNIPLFFGILYAISFGLSLLGMVLIILSKKSKKFQNWAEKELLSFGKHQMKKDMRKEEKSRKKSKS